jgi:hypothetical protein
MPALPSQEVPGPALSCQACHVSPSPRPYHAMPTRVSPALPRLKLDASSLGLPASFREASPCQAAFQSRDACRVLSGPVSISTRLACRGLPFRSPAISRPVSPALSNHD